MTQLIDLAGVTPDNRNKTISMFHDQELDQALVYDMSSFRDVGELLKLAGIKTLKDRFSLFKCLNRGRILSGFNCIKCNSVSISRLWSIVQVHGFDQLQNG